MGLSGFSPNRGETMEIFEPMVKLVSILPETEQDAVQVAGTTKVLGAVTVSCPRPLQEAESSRLASALKVVRLLATVGFSLAPFPKKAKSHPDFAKITLRLYQITLQFSQNHWLICTTSLADFHKITLRLCQNHTVQRALAGLHALYRPYLLHPMMLPLQLNDYPPHPKLLPAEIATEQ